MALENKWAIVSFNKCGFFGRNLRETISPQLSSKSISDCAEFSENLVASRVAQQLIENLSMVFIFSSGLYSMTEGKVKIEQKRKLSRCVPNKAV